MKCIAFSLYGNEPRYTIGAIKNAILASRYFPFDDGFIVRFYISVNSSVDESIISTLERVKGVQISIVGEPEDHRAKLWRYYAFSDPQFDAVICRDVDARLSFRDRVAHASIPAISLVGSTDVVSVLVGLLLARLLPLPLIVMTALQALDQAHE